MLYATVSGALTVTWSVSGRTVSAFRISETSFKISSSGSSPPASRTRTSTSPGSGDVAFTSAIRADADFAKYSYPPIGPAVEYVSTLSRSRS